jgi:uncharacterized protein (TIGR02145 family)
LLSGYRDFNGPFYDLGYYTFFWSSTENYTYGAYLMYLKSSDSNVYIIYSGKEDGFSVRCVKD